jgi:hypothetical protein
MGAAIAWQDNGNRTSPVNPMPSQYHNILVALQSIVAGIKNDTELSTIYKYAGQTLIWTLKYY